MDLRGQLHVIQAALHSEKEASCFHFIGLKVAPQSIRARVCDVQ